MPGGGIPGGGIPGGTPNGGGGMPGIMPGRGGNAIQLQGTDPASADQLGILIRYFGTSVSRPPVCQPPLAGRQSVSQVASRSRSRSRSRSHNHSASARSVVPTANGWFEVSLPGPGLRPWRRRPPRSPTKKPSVQTKNKDERLFSC